MTILIYFICFLIALVIFAGAFYAAHYIVQLRHNRDLLIKDVEEAKMVISMLEERIEQLEFERTDNMRQFEQKVNDTPRSNWNAFEGR